MEGLLRRLSSDSSEAQSALRVVAFFDRLVETRGGIEELIRSSARLMGASAGFSGEGGLPSWGYDARGRPVPPFTPVTAIKRNVTTEDSLLGFVWIMRAEDGEYLSELIIERMALSAIIILGRSYHGVQSLTSPVEVILDRQAVNERRLSALAELGFRKEWAIRVLVIHSALSRARIDEYVQLWAQSMGTRCTAAVVGGDFSLIVLHDQGELVQERMPDWPFLASFGARAGALAAYESLDTGREGILLTSLLIGPKIIDYEALGALSHIAALAPDAAATTTFVRQLAFLAQSEAGLGELRALDKFCEYRSLRAASSDLNLHHSSLAHRLKNVEKKLKIDLADPRTIFLITLALQVYRVAAWA